MIKVKQLKLIKIHQKYHKDNALQHKPFHNLPQPIIKIKLKRRKNQLQNKVALKQTKKILKYDQKENSSKSGKELSIV